MTLSDPTLSDILIAPMSEVRTVFMMVGNIKITCSCGVDFVLYNADSKFQEHLLIILRFIGWELTHGPQNTTYYAS
jgi:hypothetical protein